MCQAFSGCLLEHLRKPGSLFPLHRQVSSASVYSNRGEKNTGKMLESMIVKLQTLTGGLRESKSLLHHFVFNGLDLISKCCLPLPFKKEPVYRGRRKGRGAGASKDGIGISLRFLRALWTHSSHLCSPASHTAPSSGSVGTPHASRGVLAQPWDAYGFIPRSSSNALSRCDVSGLQLATELPAARFSWAQRSNQQRGGRPERMARVALGRVLMAPPQQYPPFGESCVYGGRQLPASRARTVPTASPRSPMTMLAVQGHRQNK